MNKETKELLQRTLQMTDEKLLLRFAKSYAAKNADFAEAIIEKFLPVENTVDVRKAVADCFHHRKRGRIRTYGPSLDWTAIRKDTKKLLKQLHYLHERGDVLTAAEGALLLLETLAREFENDCLYETYGYENSNFGNEDALDIIRDILLNSKSVSQTEKQEMVNRLWRLKQSDTYCHYLPCDIEETVDAARRRLMTKDDRLALLSKAIAASTSEIEREKYVTEKVELLREMGRDKEADKLTEENIGLQAVATLKFERLVKQERLDEAKAFCLEFMAHTKEGWHTWQTWQERMAGLCQQTKDTKGMQKALRWLFLHGNIFAEKKREYFHTLSHSMAQSEWPAYRDEMLNLLAKEKIDPELVLSLYEEEQLYDRIFQYISNLPDYSFWNYGDNATFGGQRFSFFARYVNCLTEEQCNQIESSLLRVMRQASQTVSTRQEYAQLAKSLNTLSQTCERGREDVRQLVAKILRDNPHKPAFQEEMKKYEY